MKDRIKKIRTSPDINKSQTDFAKSISVSRSAVCKMESGENYPSEQTIHLICNEYNVNETWLRTGKGEMFLSKSHEEEIAELTHKLLIEEESSFKNRLISALSKLTDEQWDMLEQIIDTISAQKKE